MDYRKGEVGNVTPIINRMCRRCGTHWHGPSGAVAIYTRAEWEAWINEPHPAAGARDE